MSAGQVHCVIADGIASIVFDRPEARNAMTWAMYDGLAAACDAASADPTVRVVTFRGAGGKAFVAGTDITQFASFETAEDGVGYEKKIDTAIDQIACLATPTIAVVEGSAMGGGLAIAAACDFRFAAAGARFGVPIARTVGNCLSMANMARLLSAFGQARTRRLLLLADTIEAEEAASCGFVHEVVPAEEIGAKVDAMCRRLMDNAPITMKVAKEAIRRITIENLPSGEDLIRACYGSADFKAGVQAFIAKRSPNWQGR